MSEQIQWRDKASQFAFLRRASELLGVPVDYDRCEKVEPRDPEVPGLGCPVTDLSLASDPQRALQRMVRPTLVQAGTGASLHVDIEHPIDHEQCPFDPSDFPERDGQVMLTRE